MDRDQAIKLAQSKAEEITRHERVITGRLPADNLGDRRLQLLLERLFIHGFAGFNGMVRRDQPVRPRQAADMTRCDMTTAGWHDLSSLWPVYRDDATLAGVG